MKVLSVNKYFYRKGGSETVFFSEMGLLNSVGVEVVPFSMKGDDNLPSEYSRFFIDEVKYENTSICEKISNGFKIVYSLEAKSKINKLLLRKDFDLGHFHIFQHQISPSVFSPLKKKNIPIILTLHDLKPICSNYKMYVNGVVCEECKGGKFYNTLKNKCTKGSTLGSVVNMVEMYFHEFMKYYKNDVTKYIAVSRFYKSKMIEFGYPEDKIAYLPNYIDSSEYDFNMEEKGYVLYFGRLSEEKGITTLIRSAKINRNINYYIVGTGPIEKKLKDYVQLHGLVNVFFLGFRSGEDLKQIIAESTCVVVPSEWYENCPMTILEAYASGRPVIGSSIGGIPELINEGVDGFTFEPGNAQELADKVSKIFMFKKQSKLMGLSGRKKIEHTFNRENHLSGLLAIYNSCLGEK